MQAQAHGHVNVRVCVCVCVYCGERLCVHVCRARKCGIVGAAGVRVYVLAPAQVAHGHAHCRGWSCVCKGQA